MFIFAIAEVNSIQESLLTLNTELSSTKQDFCIGNLLKINTWQPEGSRRCLRVSSVENDL
jgi:hypothetical protein